MIENLRLKPRRGGFTLVELMVATAVMVLLVALVVQMTGGILNLWNRFSGKLSANAEARIAMELLTRDLQTAVLRKDRRQWLRVEAPTEHEGNLYDKQTVSLKLFSSVLDQPTEDDGNICAVAYRLEFQKAYDAPEAPKVYGLYRKVVDAKTTFESMMGTANQGSLLGGEWAKEKILEEKNYLVGNIVEFKIFVHRNPGGQDRYGKNFDGRIGHRDTVIFGGENATHGIDDKGNVKSYPDEDDEAVVLDMIYAEVHLTVMSDHGLKILSQQDDLQKASEVVVEHGETFIRRIYFMSQPL